MGRRLTHLRMVGCCVVSSEACIPLASKGFDASLASEERSVLLAFSRTVRSTIVARVLKSGQIAHGCMTLAFETLQQHPIGCQYLSAKLLQLLTSCNS